MSPQEPIAVIGTGCRFPGGATSPSRLWGLLSNPRDVASKVPGDRFSIESFYHRDGLHHGTTNTQESYFLEDDVRSFDAAFFNISAAEADSIDPQQRILLETIYESLESGGQTLQDLRGSSAGVFCGVMYSDYDGIMYADMEAIPRYTASGTSRAVLANRVSYFFDWHGPSMTIDTACSSSLVAVHLATKALHDGDCNVAVAAGTNLLLSPAMYVSESKLGMLSPTGRGRMWDSKADGYARGEGIASVVLKRLSDAIASGDPIECLIRATDINQDGRSLGITMPSAEAQTRLIQSTYARAGLDPRKARDRCQYFEAHGTGTPAGDPQEARAIHSAFFETGNDDFATGPGRDHLYVGSIKTIIGHTEGTAGLAGLIKGSLSMKHGMIAPNLHFDTLNPSITPFTSNVSVPTKLLLWPKLPAGVPRRVSVNSFGFGGTNAHAILESYQHNALPPLRESRVLIALPFVFSATSERSLQNVLKRIVRFLDSHPGVDLNDVAWSLLRRRTSLSHKVVFYASTADELTARIREKLDTGTEGDHLTVVSRPAQARRYILGVFTGQGAQWPRMGIDLVSESAEVRGWIEELQVSLDTLPAQYRPTFSLLDELSASQTSSRIHQAAISQPVCTAIQIVLVNIMRTLGIQFSTVVGHSSGEIGAAYAAGILSAYDAIRIAHLRGHLAYHAGVPGKKGSMLAAGISYREANALCAESKYKGRLAVAAVNSPSTVTLSGDQDAIEEAAAHLNSNSTFSRVLKVDTAYHSHHMAPCSEPYLCALGDCRVQICPSMASRWISSVYKGERIAACHMKGLQSQYWVDNMSQTVLFHQALETAARSEPVDMIIEIGPHPALKGPAMQTLSSIEESNSKIPYVGLLNRGASGIETVASAIAAFWSNLSMTPANLEGYTDLFYQDRSLSFVKDLPTYPFDHSQSYWGEARASKAVKRPQIQPNMLLGRLADVAEGEWRWRNFLRREEMEWLDDHRVQSQSVFPAAGYVAMAHEAARIVARDAAIRLIEVKDLVIDNAIQISDSPTGTETSFALEAVKSDETSLQADFSCQADIGGKMKRCATGRLWIAKGEPDHASLPPRSSPVHGLTPIDNDTFYSFFDTLGLGYNGLFRGIKSLERKRNTASGTIAGPVKAGTSDDFLLHPGTMDSAMQTSAAALGSPEDGQLYTLHVPARIRKITISLVSRDSGATDDLAFDAILTATGAGITADIDLFDKDGNGILQIEGLHTVPLMPPTTQDDRLLFSDMVWGPLYPNAAVSCPKSTPGAVTELQKLENFALGKLRTLTDKLTPADRATLTGHRAAFLQWIEQAIRQAGVDQHPICAGGKLSADSSTEHNIKDGNRSNDWEIIHSATESLVSFLCAGDSKSIAKGGEILVSEFQEASAEFADGYRHMAHVVKQIGFRFPCMKILEIGGGTGAVTKAVLDQIGTSFHSYTYTHTSDALEMVQAQNMEQADGFICRKLDIEKDPSHQGFSQHSYDTVVISHSLYTTESPSKALKNIRSLVKPGGYIVLMEVTDANSIYLPVVFGYLGDFWQTEDGNSQLPLLEPTQWDSLLKEAGFSGIETLGTPSGLHTVFVSQAMDDRISLLRNPFSMKHTEPGSEGLVIIGGASSHTSALVTELDQLLRPYFANITCASGLSILKLPQSGRVAVLIVAELDSECFKDLTPTVLQNLQTLLKMARKLLWVTPGPGSKTPYHAMIQGLLRCVALENKKCHYQQMSVDGGHAVESKMLASVFLQLVHADSQNDHTMPGYLWTTEPELWLKESVLHIPRFLPSDSINKRYMAGRRPIYGHVQHRQCKVTAVNLSSGTELVIDTSAPVQTDQLQIEVDYSSPMAIQIHEIGFLHVIIGRMLETKERVLALTAEHASVVTVASSWVLPLPGANVSSADALAAMRAALVALHVLKSARPGTSILLHDSNKDVRNAVLAGASEFNVRPFFSTSRRLQDSNTDLIFIHPETSIRRLKQLLPVRLSVVAHATPASGKLKELCIQTIPDDAKNIDVTNLYRQSSLHAKDPEDDKAVACMLASAWTLAQATQQDDSVIAPLIPIQEFSGKFNQRNCAGVVDWTAGEYVTVREQVASSYVALSPNRSYLLIGMTGDLGCSVCEWMISRGARVVILASRTPKLEQWWVDEMARSGATVKAIPMDVTNRESIIHADKMIQEELPPIGGIVNGAMVLNEHFFTELSFEDTQRMLKPKVDGSILLDELYSDKSLDFFILFGSSVGMTGNTGQAPYAAATTFMAELISRRRARDLVGSIINPAGIYNVGFVARLGGGFSTIAEDILGILPISERDLHEVFAEGILAGRVDSGRNPLIIAGLGFADPLLQPRVQWYSDPRLWNFIQLRGTGRDSTGDGNQGQTKGLASASTLQEAADIIHTLLVAKVRKTLKLSPEVSLTADSILMELGVDSLIAVELRSWLIKQISVDIPVLKIFGGLSIGDIVRQSTASSSLLTQLRESPPEEASKEETSSGNRSFSASDTPLTPDESTSDGGISSSSDFQFNLQPEPKANEGKKRSYQKVERLSFGQSRFWFLNHYLQDQAAYNVTRLYRMDAIPHIENLRAAINTVGMRHESLRTCYLEEDANDGNPCQAILSSSPLQLEEFQVDDEDNAFEEYNKLQKHVYDIREGDVARARLISCPNSCFLLLGWHHTAMDGESAQIFLKELGLAYVGEPLPPRPKQYTEFAASQRAAFEQGEMEDDLRYWKSQFATIPEPIPLLPVTGMMGPRRPLEKYELEELRVDVDSATMNKIREACKRLRASPFHFFLTVLRIFLIRLTGANDICIGTANANRFDPANEGIVGFLLNLMPIRFTDTSTDIAFGEVLGNTRDLVFKALAHSQLPFDALLNEMGVPRSTTHSPLFQVLLDWQPLSGDGAKLGDIELSTEDVSPGQTSYDLSLLVVSTIDGGSNVTFRLQKALYGRGAGAQVARGFMNLLRAFANDCTLAVDDPPIYPSMAESETEIGKGPSMTAEWPSTLSRRIDEIAFKTPEKPAIRETNGIALTYEELQTTSDSIASQILALNPKAGARVCVFQHPSASLIASMLAIWKLNLVYVPLDLRNPVRRLVSMVEDCRPSILLCSEETQADAETLELSGGHIVSVSSLYPSNRRVGRVENMSEPQAAAVILYTSGTTGRPKGIQLHHEGLRNQIEGYTTQWGIGAETVLQQAAITFDHSLDQILIGLCNGGLAVVATRSLRGDPVALTKVLVEEKITYTKATPSEYAAWLRYGFESCRHASNWRFAFGGGEPMSSSLAKSFRDLGLSSLRLFNSYGPAEITISSHKMEVDYKSDTMPSTGSLVPAGYPMPNYSAYIVDKKMRCVAPGISGEVLIGGPGLCMGYLGQEMLNMNCFIDNPFMTREDRQQGWTKLYRTLDRGYLLGDGRLVIEGRLDGNTQIKIRGIRMELGDIENSILEASKGAIVQVVVTVREDEGDDLDLFLVAHVIFAPHCSERIHAQLKQVREDIPLPQYMHPSVIVPVAELPLTGHGKVDRGAVASLPLPEASKAYSYQNDTLTAAEKSMAYLWAAVLRPSSASMAEITSSTDFFLTGGSSILLVKLQSLIHKTMGVALPLIKLFENSRLGRMAYIVDRSKPALTIDWEAETCLSGLALEPKHQLPAPPKGEGLTIILTGVTGFLGKEILQRLLSNPNVARVHAVAVRPRGSTLRTLPTSSAKLTLHKGDFALPHLGLDESTSLSLSQTADVVIHCGGGRSFWDSYHVLRDSVSSTKSLIELVNRRGVPIHFISSGSVKNIAEGSTPPTDGQLGYTASKWASERLLCNAATQLGMPVVCHRPMPGIQALEPSESLAQELKELVMRMRCIPTAGGWSGSVDLLPAFDLASDVVASALATTATSHSMQIEEHSATMRLGTAEFLQIFDEDNRAYEDFHRMPFVKWIGLAKREYGFRWLVTSQDATVQEGMVSLVPQL